MAMKPSRIILFLVGLLVALGIVSYGTGWFAPSWLPQVASTQGGGTSSGGNSSSLEAALPDKPDAPTSGQTQAPASGAIPQTSTQPSGEATTPGAATDGNAAANGGVVSPSFDVVRVEGDGSTVIAGKAAPNATVEIVAGSKVLGQAKANEQGDFAIVLDEPLAPGDYTMVLRATGADGVATSTETAIVSVPETANGQVLAMVEEPGQASRVLTAPNPDQNAAGQAPTNGEAQPNQQQASTAPDAATTAGQLQGEAKLDPNLPPVVPQANGKSVSQPTIEAVEIEGNKLFVAGAASPLSRLRIYADDMLLGEIIASEAGRFLVETRMALPVGTHTIRVDTIGADGESVIARAAVPFEREPGENMAAVAPAPATGASQAGQGAASGGSASASAGGSVSGEAAKLERVNSAVIIRKGDSLWRISRRAYGQGVRYSTIYLANQDQIQNPNKIWPGQVFRMPKSSQDGAPVDMDSLGDQATQQPEQGAATSSQN